MRVMIRGVIYPSVNEAASAVGVHVQTLRRAINEGWHDEVGLPHRKGGRPGKPCTYRGKPYPSRTAAAAACGVSVAAVCSDVRRAQVAA